jgi:radical SAM superfamily enzyme with C-terminal helix-hairpin-helix motif
MNYLKKEFLAEILEHTFLLHRLLVRQICFLIIIVIIILFL